MAELTEQITQSDQPSQVKIYGCFEEEEFKVFKRGVQRSDVSIKIIGMAVYPGDTTEYIAKLQGRTKSVICQWPVEQLNTQSLAQAFIKEKLGRTALMSFPTNSELQAYIRAKTDSYYEEDVLLNLKGTRHIGFQKDGILILNEEIQLSSEGNLLHTDDENRYMLHPDCQPLAGLDRAMFGKRRKKPLRKTFNSMKLAFRHNFGGMVATIAAYIYLIGYERLTSKNKSVPTMVLYSQATDTGKTSACKLAAELFCQPAHSVLANITNSRLKTKSKHTTFPTIIDDAEMDATMRRRVINLYVAASEEDSTSKTVHEKKSGLMISTNFNMKDIDRFASKMLLIGFSGPSITPDSADSLKAFDGLSDRINKAKGGFMLHVPGLVNELLELTAEERFVLMNEVREALGAGINSRLMSGYANLLLLMKRVVALGGLAESEAVEYLADCCKPLLDEGSMLKDRCSMAKGGALKNFCDDYVRAPDVEKKVIARGMHRGQKALFINEASLTGPLAASFAAVRSNISMDRAVRNINEKKRKCHVLMEKDIAEDDRGNIFEAEETPSPAPAAHVLAPAADAAAPAAPSPTTDDPVPALPESHTLPPPAYATRSKRKRKVNTLAY